ncbi:hypothetical protein QBC38DRAFT_517791 [Podospora fimiseda]|uniref:Uncharacterized protein n=1 Tax=Podospora fimiseda TaxID=252190 RepID=A0AAN6YTR6_9PEZI|nr:hypothetical protein QBC38DRAFT_517791 [Podospora fimiseda]
MARQYANATTVTATQTTVSTVLPDRCTNFDATQTCSFNGDYGNCLSRSGDSYCRCNNGPQYLSCVSSAIGSSSCTGVVGDWNDFQRTWLLGSCSAPPSSVMAILPQPSTVELSTEPVAITTPPVPITILPPEVVPVTYQPSSGGNLLAGDCSSTTFSVINAGDVMFYAPIVGCNANRPECCPWLVSGTPVAGSTPAPTTAGPNARDLQRVAAAAGQFPVPADGQLQTLPRCPNDFYSVSGQCCPNGYFKFTREMAAQTPCFSSLVAKASPPVITVGAPGVPPSTNVATSALVNIALAMSYQVDPEPTPTPSSSGLSQGAIIGIGIGAGILGILLIAMIACLVVRARKNKRKQQQPVPSAQMVNNPFADAPGLGGGNVDPNSYNTQQGMTYKAGYHAPLGSPPPPSMTTSPAPYGAANTIVSSASRYTPTVASSAYSTLPEGQTDQVHNAGQGGYNNGVWGEREYSQGGGQGQWAQGQSQGWQQRWQGQGGQGGGYGGGGY